MPIQGHVHVPDCEIYVKRTYHKTNKLEHGLFYVLKLHQRKGEEDSDC